ncbi:MAG TPA: LysM peptidoglycan-binding domain-containing protein [Clostridiales bacterium]|nr:LysM peptidoglycan-binding domain-containing protein [Clostridiales bacterium]
MVIHVVQPGETIKSIAELYQLPEDRIILENAILNPDNLVVGQTIVIVYPLITHTVQEGDTLADIANQYQVPLMQLLRNNPYLSDREYIYPGETIVISYETDKIATKSTGGYVYSFVSRDILRKTLPFLTFLTVFDYFVNANGEISDVDDQDIVDMAKAYRVFPMMLISTLSQHGVGSREADLFILEHPEIQDIMIDNVLANIRAKGYYGLNQYFQYLSPDTKTQTENFIIKMSNRLKSEGLRYTVTITPQVNIERTDITYETIDYSVISQYVDAILFLSFDWGYSFAPSASAIPLSILETVIRNFTEVVPPEKFALGLSVIGYDWALPYVPGYTVANAITFDAAIQIAADSGVDIQFNVATASPYYFYNNIEGALHNVWFKDARSIDQISRLVPKYGLQGLFIWNNMYFFTQMWLVINNLYDIVKLLN